MLFVCELNDAVNPVVSGMINQCMKASTKKEGCTAAVDLEYQAGTRKKTLCTSLPQAVVYITYEAGPK